MKKTKKILLFTILIGLTISLTACQNIKMFFKDFEQSFRGLEMTIQTYDEQSQMIDQIKGKSVMIERDEKFDSSEEKQDSSVIKVTVGHNELHHVGSSMIVMEKGLKNVFDAYTKKVDITAMDRSIPVINSMMNDMKNTFTGKKKVVLIRSQNGTPLATFVGNKVSLYKTEVPKSTGLLVDGKYLFVYRCDYTIYDTNLFE